MSVLITGGAGYIGSHTAVELLNSGKDIVVIDNFSNSGPVVLDRVRELTGSDFPFYNCDIRDKFNLSAIFEKERIDSVIHFAALKSVPGSIENPLLYYDNNVNGTIRLLEVMSGFSCKNMVFSSSATVYGRENEVPFKETMKTGGTTNPYGTTKCYVEQILNDLYISDNDFSISLLRYFNPIGAHESGRIGDSPSGAPGNIMPLITQAAVGKLPALKITGNDYPTPDGTGLRDYFHVVDLAKGHLKALERVYTKTGVDVYNLGSGKGTSVFELVGAFEKASGIKIQYEICPRRPGDLAEAYADVSKAKEELGWE
ncbi:MAG: UDP-glucose 4-epimerase GalE, partial [Oscillospiraceae bacterium]|nr:UDP-glucose 4-epimerase GalE [Oscillospiraceae bacterium]